MQRQQVRRFYSVLWDAHDLDAMPSILHEQITFRGSLGQEKHGHDGFADYVNMVHQALGNYRCHIEELIEEHDKVFAKLTFSGIHRNHFLGYAASGKTLSWTGCALFTFTGELIRDIWVLGDMKGLEQQLRDNSPNP